MSASSSRSLPPAASVRTLCRRGHDLADSLVRSPPAVLGLALVLAGMVFVLVTSRALPLVGGLAAVLAIGCGGPWLAIAGARGRVRVSRARCRVGEAVEAGIDLVGRRHRSGVTVTWPDVVQRVTLPAGGGRITVRPQRRGRFPRRLPRLESDAPFGILAVGRPLEMAGRLVVWPVTAPIRFPAALVAPRCHGREPSEGVPGSAGDVLGVRGYRAGDTARSIHWVHTARHDAVLVCERSGDGAPAVRLFIDRDAAPEPVLDAVVTLAASILESWVPRGIRVALTWSGGPVHRPRERRELDFALDAVACLEANVAADTGAGDRGGQAARGRVDPADLDVLVTTVARRQAFEAQVADWSGRPTPAGRPRLIVLVDEAADAPRTIRRRDDLDILLPVADAAAALDLALTEIGHDPDTRRD
jgi:uncharacterized protein (DUF58 family)